MCVCDWISTQSRGLNSRQLKNWLDKKKHRTNKLTFLVYLYLLPHFIISFIYEKHKNKMQITHVFEVDDINNLVQHLIWNNLESYTNSWWCEWRWFIYSKWPTIFFIVVVEIIQKKPWINIMMMMMMIVIIFGVDEWRNSIKTKKMNV